MVKSKKHISFIILLAIFSVSLVILSMNVGVVKLTPVQILNTLIGNGSAYDSLVLWDIRLPRAFTACVVGIALSVSGAVMQGVTGNEIATPGMLGITSGASLGVLSTIYLRQYISFIRLAVPVCAMLGGLLVFSIVYALSIKSKLSPAKLILNGLAINSCIGAFTVLLVYRLSPGETTYINIVLNGTITSANFSDLFIALPFVFLITVYIFNKTRYLNILTLGEELSVGLGVNLLKERRKLLFASVLLASVSSFLVGGLTFVGLLASHVSRKLVGGNYQKLLPVSVFVGIIVMLVSDMLARTMFVPSELPIGNMVSLIGTPYLMYVLLKTDK